MKNRSVCACIAILVSWVLLISGCTKSPEEKRDAYLKSAAGYVNEGKYAEAAIQYQNALQIAPDDAKALVALGEADLKLMKANEAYKAFSRAISADPKNTKAHEYLTSMQLLAKRYDLAEKQARTILGYEPDNRSAREMLAQALFKNEKKNEAVRIIDELLKDPKPSETAFINAVQMYMGTGRTNDALSLISRGASLYAASSKIRFLASDVYAFKGDHDLARKWAEDAYRVETNSIGAGIALARFYAGHRLDEPFNALIAELKTKFPKDSSPYILESEVMQKRKDLDKALALAEKALRIEDSTLNKTMTAQILLEKGEKAKAEKILVQAVEKDTKDIPSRILLTQIYLQGGNPQKALDTLEMLIKSIPRRPDVAVPAARAYLMKGDPAKARELVEKSLEEYKNNVSLHAMLAKIRFSEGRYEDTLAEVDLLGKNSAATPDILYIGALSGLKLGLNDKAAGLIDSLKKLSPDSWQAVHAQCLLCISKSDKQGAYRLAEKALNLFPDAPQALSLYAGIAPSVISKEETIRKVTDACSKNNTAFCRMILARLLETSGNVDGALGRMKEAVALEPDNTSLYHALAQFYARHDMIKKAIDEYEAIVNKNPDDLKAAMMLALINQGRGKTADAQKVYAYILEKEPKNALAANNLSWILAESGKKSDLNEALKLAQIAKDKFPEDPRIADTLGYVYLKKGLAENALGQFQLALEKLPQEPAVNYHAALALVELSRNPEAGKFLETALRSQTDFTEKAEVLKLLAKIRAESKK